MTVGAHELARQTGATWRQLSHWTRKGWLKPDSKTGTGHPLRFNDNEAVIASIAVELVTELNMHPQTACHHARVMMMSGQSRHVIELPKYGRLIIWQARAEVPQAPESEQ